MHGAFPSVASAEILATNPAFAGVYSAAFVMALRDVNELLRREVGLCIGVDTSLKQISPPAAIFSCFEL